MPLWKAHAKEPKTLDDLANKVCELLSYDGSPVKYTRTTPRRSPRRTSPRSAGSMDTSGWASGSMKTGSSGLKCASKAPSVSFDDHGIDNMRERVAARKKNVADEATKSTSSKGKASKATKKATADGEGRELSSSVDRALHGCLGDIGDMEDATAADCTALRPLAQKPAAVYKPCALQAKKTELTEGAGDTHGIRPRRKEGIAGWLARVLCGLGYCDHQLMPDCGTAALLEKHGHFNIGRNWRTATADWRSHPECK